MPRDIALFVQVSGNSEGNWLKLIDSLVGVGTNHETSNPEHGWAEEVGKGRSRAFDKSLFAQFREMKVHCGFSYIPPPSRQ